MEVTGDLHAKSDGSGSTALTSNGDSRMADIFRGEELARERMAFRVRAASLFVISIWLTFLMPLEDVPFYHALLLLFILVGFGHYWVTRSQPNKVWLRIGLIMADFGLLAFATLADNPLNDWVMAPPLRLGNGNFGYFFVVLVSIGLSYSAWRMIASGIIAGVAWAAGYIWISLQPGSFTHWDRPMDGVGEWLAAHTDPNFVDLHVLYQDLIILGIVTGILSIAVLRSRRLVLEQVRTARERANLARYFSPNIVDGLAERDEPLGAVRSQKVAVLFADIVDFTRWAERHTAAEVIGLLREVHMRLEACVFEHNGTLDKFLGDGLMATFGTPEPGPNDAVNALKCGRSMVEAIDAWNQSQPTREPIRLSVGIQYGDVVVGDIGSARRMEFTVLGDAVNVASRLEAATREFGCRILVGDAVVAAARAAAGAEELAPLLGDAKQHPGIHVKGHSNVTAYALP